jgi:hypothetical protein
MTKTPRYFIYHIEGIKIGVTDNPLRRAKQYKMESLEIIETETSAKRAGEKEIAYQKHYGYPVDRKAYHKVKYMTNKRRKK